MIVAANRDEFHARPARNAGWWPELPGLLGGRDELAGGTWLAVGRNGRFATVTNFRDADAPPAGLDSRGHLVTGFLESRLGAVDYLAQLAPDRYAGFNLLVGDGDDLAYLSNRRDGIERLDPGIYGIANHVLDSPWSKVVRSKDAMSRMAADGQVDEDTLLAMLADRQVGDADDVETGRLPYDKARAITAPFIVLPDYGTRCSTVVIREDTGRVRFTERRFDAGGYEQGTSTFAFEVEDQSA